MKRIPASPKAFLRYLQSPRPDPEQLLRVVQLYREGILGPEAVRLARMAYQAALGAPSDREIEGRIEGPPPNEPEDRTPP